MWQLDLFGAAPLRLEGPGEQTNREAPAPESVDAPAPAHPRQLDLFAELLARRRRGLERLVALDLDAAREDLRVALDGLADLAPSIREELALLDRVSALVHGLGETPAFVEALEAIEREWPARILWLVRDVRRALYVRLAESMEARGGPGAVVGGFPSGEAFHRAGAPSRAVQSLEHTVRARPLESEHWIRLGNARLACGEIVSARLAYATAYLADPSRFEDARVDDPAVRALATSADTEVEVETGSDPREWVPVLGVFAGLFAVFARPAGLPDPQRDAARFFALLAEAEESRARGDAGIAARRALRALEPRVFARYLDFVRGRS